MDARLDPVDLLAGLDHDGKPSEAPPAAPSSRRAPARPDPGHRARYRIWFMSDLRIDRGVARLPDTLPEFDAMVVAGGVGPGLVASMRWLADALDGRQRGRPVGFVPGAVEFTDGVPVPKALEDGERCGSETGIALLHDASMRLGDPLGDGLHVLGSTLWVDFSVDGTDKAAQARGHARSRWTEARPIRRTEDRPFLPHDVAGAHARGRAFIEDGLTSIWAGGEALGRSGSSVVPGIRGGDRAVVASAFPPCRACLPPSLAYPLVDPWTATWRASALDALFEKVGAPVAWMTGGVPYALDMRLGRTRVVANPYQDGDPTRGFEIGRVLTV